MSFKFDDRGFFFSSLSLKEQALHILKELKKLYCPVKKDYELEKVLLKKCEHLFNVLPSQDRALLSEIISLRCGMKDVSSKAKELSEATKRMFVGKNGIPSTIEGLLRMCFEHNGEEVLMMTYPEIAAELAIGGYTEFFAPSKGDVVLDVGAFTGDSTQILLTYIGHMGTIFAFEPGAEQMKIARLCCAIGNWSGRIKLIPYALSSELGTSSNFLMLEGHGADARLTINTENEFLKDKTGLKPCKVTTIDRFCAKSRIIPNFIKIDAEGEDLNVLRGAQSLIYTHAPTIAVAIYHDISHFEDIPRLLHTLCPRYKFRLGHYSAKGNTETVLYASVK